jgi:ketosteroid isomerase-like protein
MRNAIVLLFVGLCAQAQTPLEEIVAAEKRFAQMSVDNGMRAAFLANFNDETIAFQQGEPVAGRKGWAEGEESNAYLFWWPVWADVSSSGDFGYTTGPAVLGGERQDPKPTRGMYYASVWKQDDTGTWKVVADLGTGTYDPAENKVDFAAASIPKKKGKGMGDAVAAQNALFEMDRSYLRGLNEAKASFDKKHFTSETRVHRPGRKPATTAAEILALDEKGKFSFEQTGGDIASSGDMGVTWGKVKVLVVRDGIESTIPVCYMRVWRKDGGEWKIVLDVIG